MSEVQEEIVEKAARALYEAHWGNTIGAPDWGTVWLVPSVADDWRRKAKATVTASGIPAAIEARDKALERVKALEGALDKFWDTYGEFSDGLLFCSHCEAEGGNPNRRASWRDTPHDAGCPFGIARATHD